MPQGNGFPEPYLADSRKSRHLPNTELGLLFPPSLWGPFQAGHVGTGTRCLLLEGAQAKFPILEPPAPLLFLAVSTFFLVDSPNSRDSSYFLAPHP